MKEIGLYIHIPFCKKKCLYCDFNSFEDQSSAQTYVEALIKEIQIYRKKLQPKYKTVFIGGGTPTYIHFLLIGKIMRALEGSIDEQAEISMECNPGTITEEALHYYRQIGINRLSIGLQAWQDRLLKGIGRIHCLDEFIETYTLARKAGFDNINIDLMFSLPGQTLEDWDETIQQICRLNPEHISSYSLKLEEGTKMHGMYMANQIQIPDENIDRQMYHHAIAYFKSSGYSQYEISNFCKAGFECKHNLIYWKNQEYIGVGAGSHSKLDNRRFWNVREIKGYIEALNKDVLPVEGEEHIDMAADLWETIFLSLRLNSGLDIAQVERKYAIDFHKKYAANIKKLMSDGLIEIDGNQMRLTEKGQDLSNRVFIEFMD